MFNIPQMRDHPENRGKDDTFLKRGGGEERTIALHSPAPGEWLYTLSELTDPNLSLSNRKSQSEIRETV